MSAFCHITFAITIYLFSYSVGTKTGFDDILLQSDEEIQRNPGWQTEDGLVRIDGDIMLTRQEYDETFGSKKRAASYRNPVYHWDNGIVVYYIEPGLYNSTEIRLLKGAMAEWERHTCVKFKQITSKRGHYMTFVKKGCWSLIGASARREGQKISLSYYCFTTKTLLHELGHALGLYHEQSRPDRNKFITFHRENLRHPSGASQFLLKTLDRVAYYGTTYDYYSIMHYSATAYAKKGKKTITAKNPKYTNIIGTKSSLSFQDIMAVNNIYKCGKRCGLACVRGGYMDKKCQCRCPGNRESGMPSKICSKKPSTKPPVVPCMEQSNCPCKDLQRNCNKKWCFQNKSYTKSCLNTCGLCQKIHNEDNSSTCSIYKSSCFKNASITKRCVKTCGVCTITAGL